MTHSHDDRVAETQSGMCAAYGCPLHGSNTNATTGGGDWLCALHFGREGQLQQVTSAINRNRWLADVITLVRRQHPKNPNRHADMDKVKQLIDRHGWPELHWAGGRETVRQWVNRLEPELTKMVLAEIEQPAQASLPGQQDTWAKASANLPNFA